MNEWLRLLMEEVRRRREEEADAHASRTKERPAPAGDADPGRRNDGGKKPA